MQKRIRISLSKLEADEVERALAGEITRIIREERDTVITLDRRMLLDMRQGALGGVLEKVQKQNPNPAVIEPENR